MLLLKQVRPSSSDQTLTITNEEVMIPMVMEALRNHMIKKNKKTTKIIRMLKKAEILGTDLGHKETIQLVVTLIRKVM